MKSLMVPDNIEDLARICQICDKLQLASGVCIENETPSTDIHCGRFELAKTLSKFAKGSIELADLRFLIKSRVWAVS